MPAWSIKTSAKSGQADGAAGPFRAPHTSGNDARGADFYGLFISYYNDNSHLLQSSDIQDVSGNVYTILVDEPSGPGTERLAFAFKNRPATNILEAWTVSNVRFAGVTAVAIVGSDGVTTPTHVEGNTPSGSTVKAGSFGSAGQLILTGVGVYPPAISSIDSSFIILQQDDYTAGNNIGVGLAWPNLSGGIAGAVDPKWTFASAPTECQAINVALTPMPASIGTFAGSSALLAVSAGSASQSLSIVYEAYLSGAWVDLADDVVEAGGITMSYGIQGDGPQDLVASSGQCSFLLRNDLHDGKPLGYYSPANSSVRSGWMLSVPFRVRFIYASVSYTRFTGKVYVILPDTGIHGRRQVAVTAYDVMRSLGEADVQAVAIQVSKSEDQVISAVLDSLPSTEQPIARDLDPGADVFDYALDNLGTSTKALSILADAACSAFYMLASKGNGTLIGRSRHTLQTNASTFVFSGDFLDLQVPSDMARLYNLVKVTAHPKTVDPLPTTVLYSLTGKVPVITPGETRTFIGGFNDPTNAQKLIGGVGVVTALVAYPNASYDYAGNSAEDGTGADLTSSLSIVATAYASSCQFDVTNVGALPVFLVAPTTTVPMLRIRGRGVYDRGAQQYQASSSQPYGTRPRNIDLIYQGDGNVAQSAADYIQSLYNSLTRRVQKVTFVAMESNAKMLLAMTVEPGDRITISEPVTGIVAVEALVQSVSLTVVEKRFITCTLGLSVASTLAFWRWGIPGRSEWGLTTIYGF